MEKRLKEFFVNMGNPPELADIMTKRVDGIIRDAFIDLIIEVMEAQRETSPLNNRIMDILNIKESYDNYDVYVYLYHYTSLEQLESIVMLLPHHSLLLRNNMKSINLKMNNHV